MDERLYKVLLRVRAGATITEAIKAEGMKNAFYRHYTSKERAPIVAARLEVEQMASACEDDSSPNFVVYMPSVGHKLAFLAECQAEGTTMSRCVNSLVSAYMQSKRDTP